MCQQGPNEIAAFQRMGWSELKERFRKHQTGEATLTDEQLKEIAVRMYMLSEGG